jgi:integrase
MRVIRGIFEIAFEDEAIEFNWTKGLNVSARDIKDLQAIKPFSKEEVKILLEESKSSIYGEHLHLYLGVNFNEGMSPSEIIGLKVEDIDFESKTINIQRNITKNKIKGTKNIYRTRKIPIFETAIPYLSKLIQIAKTKNSPWLFSDENGLNLKDIENVRGSDLIIKNNIIKKNRSRWYLLLNNCELEYRAIKNCRHTFAVGAIESKCFTLQEIASILGHNSLQMLINHYAKWIGNKGVSVDRSINIYN